MAYGDSAAEIDQDVSAALKSLYASDTAAKDLGTKAKAVLVFPDVLKAGLILGGQYGEGALRMGGKTVGYYNTVAASYGLQAGAQTFIYSMRGRPRWFTIGSVIGIGLKDARQIAREKRADVGRGIDVQAERAASRRQSTFEELAQRYVEEYARRRNKSWKQADALVRR